MADPRVLVDPASSPQVGGELQLDGPPAHHLIRVLRVRAGDPVVIFDGSGCEWRTTVAEIDGRCLRLNVLASADPQTECPTEITLLQGLCRGERMDYVMQKATELGAAAIIAINCDRSNVRLEDGRAEKRLEHWRGVTIAATEQSGRVRLPAVHGPVELSQALSTPAELRLVLVPGSETRLSAAIASDPVDSIALLVGPEGGFSEAEVDAATTAGWRAVSMGPRILRTETAGIVSLAVVQAVLGLI